jgi:hypothetical protein
MSSGKRPWWRAFDNIERRVGKPLEGAAGSARYVDLMVRGRRVHRAVGGGFMRMAGGAAGKVLHAANMPTLGDVRRLSRQIAVLTSEVRTLSASQREATAAHSNEQRGADVPADEEHEHAS